MNTATVGLKAPGVGQRGAHKAVALLIVAMMVMSTGARVTIPSLDLGHLVSVIVSKLNPADPTPERTVKNLGGKVGNELHIVDGFEAQVPQGAVGLVATSPGVRGIDANSAVRFHGQYGEGSGVASAVYTDSSRASQAWAAGQTGQGVNVAVIDTGVDITGDLSDRVVHAEDFSGENLPNKDNFGHGTFVAGLIAGNGNASGGKVKGMAPSAGIVSVKIAGRDGSTNIYRLLAGLEWVVTHKDAYGIRVLNLSLGSDSQQSYLIDPLDFAIERVWNAGIVVVTAAGNHGNAHGTIVKPADDPFVITVGAMDDRTTASQDDDKMASFSGAGPTSQDGIAKPDLVASGRSVVSSRSPGSFIDQAYPTSVVSNTYFKGSGTSFSAAVVSGAAALVIGHTWSLNPNQVKHRLVSNTQDLDNTPRYQQGAGQIDAHGATMSDDNESANRGVRPALGTGSLQASSGTACVKEADGITCLSDAAANALVGFNPVLYFGSQWAGSQWAGSQWAGSQWAGSQWTGSQWAGSQWAGSQWAGSQWAGSQWAAMTWAGSQWAGSQWAGSQWAGSQWAGSQWAGSQWAGSQWAGSQWSSLEWAGNHWT